MARRCEGELAAPSSDRQYRDVQLLASDEGCDFVAFLEHGLVEADRSAPAIGTRVGTDELIDVSVGDRSRVGAHAGKANCPRNSRSRADEEHFGDPRGSKNADVPGTPVRDVGQALKAEPG